MGLDQNAYAFKNREDGSISLAEWRKHSSLQGWMENLWRSKGGEGEFNCVGLELTVEDLEELKQDVDFGDLPETQGFFFGSGNDARYKETDLTFIKEALEFIEAGYKVEYNSWW